ncbi:MAG TPA: outer membrane protein transport protein [Burkholderiaceae bacterium]|nr:outer membrane protein transport protein [Burkholderiaceae bacterium]
MHLRPTLLAALLAAPLAAHATNGYLSHGYGVKAQGQAGVGIAWAQDALAAATNPAGTLAAGDRVDVGLSWFRPSRSADIVGNAFGADASFSGDGKKDFLVPEFGYARKQSETLGVGVAVYGNGGLNTEYRDNPYARFGATGTAGVNLEQLFISPSVAWQPSPEHHLGLALNIAYQRFSAQGISVFGGFSADPAHVSDQGIDTSVGAGLRLGWTGTLAPGLTLGATWASKVRGRFDDYRGLFADGGRFDVPENYGVGLKYAPATDWTVGADVQTIRYSEVAAVGNSIAGLLQGTPLGAPNGPGFGWRDTTVVKLAASHAVNPDLVLRAGYSHARQPVPEGETFFNILAPGVVQDHYTLGATWSRPGGVELSGFLAHAPGHTVNGSGSIPPGSPPGGFGGGNANVRLKETIIGISYAWKL